ncbi:MAG: hypothetical protein FWD09_00455 [Lentimicrobiaceae bacterium]|nr:hypothetical protein [Lentimicrobiaceae bacterium]
MELPIAKSGGKILNLYNMVTFYVVKDYETPEHAGASGLFQLITVSIHRDDDEIDDVTNEVDSGKFFRDDEELKKYFSKVFEIEEDIMIAED